jgi:nitrite reductase/ring-hydroxylating ferredoxin subunit
MASLPQGEWTAAMPAAELAERTKAVVKLAGKQILLWQSDGTIYACNNRCPHEGYPLAEGVLNDGCVLTCNWHNWKFDLATGETLVGGDRLRLYPVRTVDGTVYLELTDPPAEAVRGQALDGLREAFGEHDYERMARELVRFEAAAGDPLEALGHAFVWAQDRFEFGTTHAQAAAPDWLALRHRLSRRRAADRLVPILEIVGHLSWDARAQLGPYPFAVGRAKAFDAAALEGAIEREDEDMAVRLLRAGLADLGAEAVRPPLERAALRHYQNFGHAPIYLEKSYDLLAELGPASAESLLAPLVRSLCTGAREDLIPEFRAYAPTLEAWDGEGTDVPDPNAFRRAGVARSLRLIARAGGRLDDLYDAVMFAAADAMLHYDPRYREQIDKPVQQNIDWLDFTHAVTHLNSARKICARQPDLWPNALLQTGCFLGRNAAFVDWDRDVSTWAVADPAAFLDGIFDRLLDHGEPLYIYPAHTLKTATAVREEIARRPGAPWVPVLLAALNRFVHEPPKRKHMRRTARQAIRFVAAQG